jgi:hypothetical protein
LAIAGCDYAIEDVSITSDEALSRATLRMAQKRARSGGESEPFDLQWVNAVNDPNVQLMIDYYTLKSKRKTRP